MIIRKIRINGFGKLENKSYDFDDGINLIYGVNEAGKSTLHKFIEGLFFGFFKPYTKNKIYTDDYKKYIPWKTSAYSGAITYEKDGKLYTASRNFHKDNEAVSLHDELTGEDLTPKQDFDIVHKLHRLNRDININSILFKNTVSISQNSSKTAEELAKEIGEMLVNTAQTYSTDVSYKSALDSITAKKADIGKPTQKKSKLGMCISKEDELLLEYEKAQSVMEEVNSGYYEMNTLSDELNALEMKKEQLLKTKLNAESVSYIKRFAKYTEACKTAAEYKEVLNAQVNITEKDYERYLACTSYIEEAKKQLAKIKESCEAKHEELKETIEEKNKLAQTLSVGLDSVKEDSLLFKGLILKLKKVKEYNADEKLNEVKNKIEKGDKVKKVCLISGIALFICAFVLAAVAYFAKKDLFQYSLCTAFVALVVMGIYGFYFYQNNKIASTYDKFDTLMQKSIKYEIMFTAQIDALIEKYAVADIKELGELFAKADSLSTDFAQLENKINGIKAFLQQAEENKNDIMQEAKHRTEIARAILKQTGAKSEEEFKECLNIMRMKGEAEAKYNACMEEMNFALGNYTYEMLEEKAKKAGMTLSNKELTAEYDIEMLDMKISEITEQCHEISNRISNLEGRVSLMESGIRSLNVISEELSQVKAQRAEYEKMYRAYELAENVIVNISKEIHGDFAGIFNAFISQIASKITDGKYTDIKTDDKMNVSVKDNDTSKIVSVDTLSGATIDQLYFALRLAIAELILTDKTIPVILDDCFIQYDEHRLKNTLKYIEDVSKTRQVIIFTCRKDEKKAMDEMNIKYKEVVL